MLQTPVRVLYAFRPKVSASIVVATAVSTAVFAATPFLIPAVADDQGVSVGRAGIMSAAQLAGFVLATSLGPRLLRPRRRVLVTAAIIGALATLGSAAAPNFDLLVATRAVAGATIGLTTWLAWAEVFGDDSRQGDLAVIGPIVGVVASPLIAQLIDYAGPDWLFVVLAGLHLVPLPFVRATNLRAASREVQARHRPTRAAFAMLVALGMLTLGGSSVFVFAASIGTTEVGMSPLAVSLAFSANAAASIPSARLKGQRRLSGFWMLVTALMALTIGTMHVAPLFWLAVSLWGFAFWMGVPGAFLLLSERSAYPEERAGDAQAVMALGRVFGPLIGGAVFANASSTVLGVVGAGIMSCAALIVLYAEYRIRPIDRQYIKGAWRLRTD